MRFIKFAVLAALCMVPFSSANAGILGSLLSFNGVEDRLIDQSRSNFNDNDQSGGFSVGDVLSGFVSIDQVDADNDNLGVVDVNSPESVVFAFAAEVQSVDPTTGLTELGVSTVADQTLEDLLDADIFANVSNPGETIFVGLEGSNPASVIDESVFNSLDDFNAANGFEYVLSGGIADGTNDFFQFSPLTVPGFDIIGIEGGGFTVFDNLLGVPAGGFLPVASTRLDGTGDSFHDVTLINGTIETIENSAFDFANNSDFLINAVPEPTSILSFAGVFVLGIVPRRRRK